MKRITSLDLARGFTVLIMAPVHTVLLYSSLSVHGAWLGRTLAFLAEGPGAQLFMLLMGVHFSFGQHSFSVVIKRSVQLLLIAYTLNVCKFVVPLSLHIMPAGLQAYLQIHNNPEGVLQVFLLGDILHFAALSLIILYFVCKLPAYPLYAVLLALIICFLSPVLWDIHSGNPAMSYLLQLSVGSPPRVFFPLFPWLVYPLTGLTIGYFLKKGDVGGILTLTGIIGVLLLVISRLFPDNGESFYRTDPRGTLFHLGLVLVWLYGWYWASEHIATCWFFRLLSYYSRHITLTYSIQWVLICWLVPVFGFQQLGLFASAGAIILTSFITLFLTIILNIVIKQHRKTITRKNNTYANHP